MSTKIKFKDKLPQEAKTTHSPGEVWEYWNFIGDKQYYMLAVDILSKTWYLVHIGGYVDNKITVDYPGDLKNEDFKKLWGRDEELDFLKKREMIEIVTEEEY